MPEIIDSSVLKMAKYQLKHSNRFSTELMVDCEATRAFYIMKTMNKGNSSFNGFIHDIRQNKFGLLLFTEKQVGQIYI
jgi:hypothetical protein